MRLEAKIKMGYYPTPLSVVERVRSFLKFPEENVNLFDPCCGEGLALKKLKGDAKATTYGIELDEYRAEQAKHNLDHVIKGSSVRYGLILNGLTVNGHLPDGSSMSVT